MSVASYKCQWQFTKCYYENAFLNFFMALEATVGIATDLMKKIVKVVKFTRRYFLNFSAFVAFFLTKNFWNVFNAFSVFLIGFLFSSPSIHFFNVTMREKNNLRISFFFPLLWKRFQLKIWLFVTDYFQLNFLNWIGWSIFFYWIKSLEGCLNLPAYRPCVW